MFLGLSARFCAYSGYSKLSQNSSRFERNALQPQLFCRHYRIASYSISSVRIARIAIPTLGKTTLSGPATRLRYSLPRNRAARPPRSARADACPNGHALQAGIGRGCACFFLGCSSPRGDLPGDSPRCHSPGLRLAQFRWERQRGPTGGPSYAAACGRPLRSNRRRA